MVRETNNTTGEDENRLTATKQHSGNQSSDERGNKREEPHGINAPSHLKNFRKIRAKSLVDDNMARRKAFLRKKMAKDKEQDKEQNGQY